MSRTCVRLAAVVVVSSIVALAPPGRAQGSGSSLHDAARGPLEIERHASTGVVTFLRGKVESGAATAALRGSPVDVALAFVDRHAEALGMLGAATRLRPAARAVVVDELGMTHVRLEQHVGGVPVYGAQVLVHFAADGQTVDALNGEFVAGANVSTVPSIGRWRAARIARSIDEDGTLVGEPELAVVTERIDPDVHGNRLAWLVTLASDEPARRLYVIDARDGAVLKTRDELCSARVRRVYDLGGATEGTGQLVRSEGGGPTADADANEAYEYTGDAYDYFFAMFGRDAQDGAGAPIVSRVHLGTDLLNAFWTGEELLFGDGMTADDVVVHEYVHGVTDATAGLIYEDESGALSEAYSDVFGEIVDQLNASGDDSAGVRWLVGEDTPVNEFRDMADPSRLGQAATVSSWHCTALDNGGVHSNSGVVAKAAQLMADGGTFNGIDVTGIGLEKTARVHYRTLTLYLTPASTMLQQYVAMSQACYDMIGTDGITSDDCIQIVAAMSAVEMYQPVLCGIVCPAQHAVRAASESAERASGRTSLRGSAEQQSPAALLATAYRLRERLRATSEGRRAIEDFYEHAGELGRALERDPALARLLGGVLARATPALDAALRGEDARLSPHAAALVAAALRRLEELEPGGSLAMAVARERERLGLERLASRPLREALAPLIGSR